MKVFKVRDMDKPDFWKYIYKGDLVRFDLLLAFPYHLQPENLTEAKLVLYWIQSRLEMDGKVYKNNRRLVQKALNANNLKQFASAIVNKDFICIEDWKSDGLYQWLKDMKIIDKNRNII